MEDIKNLFGSVIAQVAQGMGIKPTDQQKLDALKKEIEQNTANNQDRLEQLRDDIRRQENRIRIKKEKQDKETGLVKQTYVLEIKMWLRRLRGKLKPAFFIISSVEANEIVLDRIRDLENAIARGVSEGQLDAIAVQIQDAYDRAEEAHKALQDLQKIAAPDQAAEPSTAEPGPGIAAIEDAPEETSAYSEADQKMLAELESERRA